MWFYEIKVFVFLKAVRKLYCQTENTVQNLSLSINIAQIINQNTLELEVRQTREIPIFQKITKDVNIQY